jgi:hypothetical protein
MRYQLHAKFKPVHSSSTNPDNSIRQSCLACFRSGDQSQAISSAYPKKLTPRFDIARAGTSNGKVMKIHWHHQAPIRDVMSEELLASVNHDLTSDRYFSGMVIGVAVKACCRAGSSSAA